MITKFISIISKLSLITLLTVTLQAETFTFTITDKDKDYSDPYFAKRLMSEYLKKNNKDILNVETSIGFNMSYNINKKNGRESYKAYEYLLNNVISLKGSKDYVDYILKILEKEESISVLLYKEIVSNNFKLEKIVK